MSLLKKAIIKSVGKGLTKKYGGDVINKLEVLTKNAQEKLNEKRENDIKNNNYVEPPTRRTLKWRKFWFYVVVTIFAIVAILLYIDNHTNNKSNKNKVDNKTETKTTVNDKSNESKEDNLIKEETVLENKVNEESKKNEVKDEETNESSKEEIENNTNEEDLIKQNFIYDIIVCVI